MKKITILIALVAFCFAAGAQQMHLQSAISYLNKKYLNKAKEEIDLAVTSDKNVDAKTWFYKAKIYIHVGQYPINPNGFKWKGETPADWRDQAYNACIECKRLDEGKEFADQNNQLLNIIGIECSNAGIDLYNAGNYAEAMQKCESAIKMFNESGNAKSSNDSYYLAGLCAYALKDTASLIKDFNTLVRKRSDKAKVYQLLFGVYKAQGKNDEAFKVASNFVKNCPKDYNAYTLQADAYLANQNMDKAKESLAQAEQLTKDNPTVHAQLLSAVGGILSNAGDYDGAEVKYKESLSLVPSQFEANFGIASMLFNRAIDKRKASEAIDPVDDESAALMTKLGEEALGLYSQSEPYLKSAISYIDGLTSQQEIDAQRANLHSCLLALREVYARLERMDDMKAVRERVAQIEAAQAQK
ncbi:MAG: tetratricopeptide repeat protein [Bacteroidales bacterium]|nr:tetratricopeptide repeat protein [Bacteroidales bacterium]